MPSILNHHNISYNITEGEFMWKPPGHQTISANLWNLSQQNDKYQVHLDIKRVIQLHILLISGSYTSVMYPCYVLCGDVSEQVWMDMPAENLLQLKQLCEFPGVHVCMCGDLQVKTHLFCLHFAYSVLNFCALVSKLILTKRYMFHLWWFCITIFFTG